MARAGQAQRLGALAAARVQDAQPRFPAADGGGLREVGGELPGYQFLPYRVTQAADAVEPRRGPAPETGERPGQLISPRLTCGFGSRSFLIWRLRMRA